MAEDQETEKVKLDVSDFAVKFEQDVSVRSHLRDDKRVLFEEVTEEKIKVACDDHIHAILKIVLTKAVATEGIPQPPIHPLRDQLEVLYKKCGRTNVDQEQIVRDSWYIRKFTGFVKMKTRKRQVSEETSLNFIVVHACACCHKYHTLTFSPMIFGNVYLWIPHCHLTSNFQGILVVLLRNRNSRSCAWFWTLVCRWGRMGIRPRAWYMNKYQVIYHRCKYIWCNHMYTHTHIS